MTHLEGLIEDAKRFKTENKQEAHKKRKVIGLLQSIEREEAKRKGKHKGKPKGRKKKKARVRYDEYTGEPIRTSKRRIRRDEYTGEIIHPRSKAKRRTSRPRRRVITAKTRPRTFIEAVQVVRKGLPPLIRQRRQEHQVRVKKERFQKAHAIKALRESNLPREKKERELEHFKPRPSFRERLSVFRKPLIRHEEPSKPSRPIEVRAIEHQPPKEQISLDEAIKTKESRPVEQPKETSQSV